MIQKYFCLVFFVFVCLLVTGSYTARAQDNLVQNFDFENPAVAPWTMWVEDAKAVAVMSIDKKESVDGKQSLLIDISKRGGGMRVELHQNPFTLKNGKKLTYAFWAKLEKDEVRPANMIVNHRADPWTNYGSKAINLTGEWTEYWTAVTMTADDSLVGIYVELKDMPGLVWFDHFRLYEGNYIEEELGNKKEKAVESRNKLAVMWAKVRTAL